MKLSEIYYYDKQSTTIGISFEYKNKLYKHIELHLKTNINVQNQLFDIYFDDKKTLQKLDLQKILKVNEIISCSASSEGKDCWIREPDPCPYFIEHIMSEWNENGNKNC